MDALRRNEKDIFVRFKSTVLKRIIWEYSVDDKLRDINKEKKESLWLSSNGKLNSRKKKIIYRSSSTFLPRESQDCLYSKSFHSFYL